AAGKAVVSTAVGGVPDVVTADVSGVLVPPADPPALAAAIDSLLRAPERRRTLGERARTAVYPRYDVSRLLADMSGLYLSLAALAVAMLAALALGLYDDIRGLRPTSKLAGQAIIGCGLAFAGVRVEAIPIAPIAFLATILWVVVIMNAVNLMDNMDGLAAGIV